MAGIIDDLKLKGKVIIEGIIGDIKQSSLNRTVETFRKTKAGQQMENTATKQKVIELLPIILIGIVIIFILGKKVKI